MLRPFLFNLLLLVMFSSQAAEFSAIFRVFPEYHHANSDSSFLIPKPYHEFNQYRGRQEIEASLQAGEFNALATTRTVLEDRSKPDYESLLNELYFDSVIADYDVTLGKKIMSWGVGYGFRPLDVLQREDRRLLYAHTLEGVPLLAWDYFADNGSAFTLAYVNPLRGQQDEHIDEESFAMKYYGLWGNMDIHAVARLSERNKGETGIGFAHVLNDALEWHGSILYQYRYQKWLNRLSDSSLLATDNPWQPQYFDNGINALLGFTWTHTSGIALLGEFWFDDSAYTQTEWEDLRQLTQNQLKQLGTVPDGAIYNNIGTSSQFFSQQNLLQQNLLLRLSSDGDNVDSALDWLYTPQDGGWVLTASLKYEFSQQHIELGARTFGGQSDSAYKAIPEDLMIYLSWQIAFMSKK